MKAAVSPLSSLPVKRWPAAGAKKLASEEPLYLVRVDESLRAIVRPVPGARPEVLDFVRHEILQLFREGAGGPPTRHERIQGPGI